MMLESHEYDPKSRQYRRRRGDGPDRRRREEVEEPGIYAPPPQADFWRRSLPRKARRWSIDRWLFLASLPILVIVLLIWLWMLWGMR